jgi:hypothetical protein
VLEQFEYEQKVLKSKFKQKFRHLKYSFFVILRNTKLIIVSHVKPIDASYEFHASFVEPAIINVDKQQDFIMKTFFNSNHSYSEQIIIKIIDEERNMFEYEVYVTADNSIFTCYAFLWKSENDYQIVVQPGQIMKGSRIKSDESNSSGMKNELSLC